MLAWVGLLDSMSVTPICVSPFAPPFTPLSFPLFSYTYERPKFANSLFSNFYNGGVGVCPRERNP